jgi:LysM repeat protein
MKSPGDDDMVVCAIPNAQRGKFVRVAALAALGFVAMQPRSATAQQPASSMPPTHTVKRGDTLWDIAKLYLGDSFLWPEIYRINSDLIEDPHWIYPGEVLKLPGASAKVIAVAPPPPPAPAPTTPRPTPIVTPPIVAPRQESALMPTSASPVRMGEYAAAPWVDQRGGPRGSGFIMQAADIPGTASADHSRLGLFDRLLISPPVGAMAPERELYLSYRLGPLIEDFGQIVIPTGIIQVTRSPRNGEAAVARVVKMFGEVRQDQRIIAYDSTGGLAHGFPSAIANGRAGTVRWVFNEPVLPSIQSYLIVDIARADVSPGDQIELFQPRQKPADGRALAIPEVAIGRAQVLRVTPYGATVLITSQVQPKIEEGTAVRVAAKIP